MKVCPRCKTRNADDACFCENCGTSLENVPVTQERPVRPQPRPRKKLSKGLIVAAAEAVVLVVLVIVFFSVGSSRTDPTKVATDYFLAMTEGDWETITALTDVPDSPFLNQEAFQAACEEWDPLNGGQLAQVSASKEESYGVSNAMESYVSNVTVEYMLRGESSVRSLPLSLVKGEGKEMFFFSQWQVVDCLPFAARNFRIEIPAGATLAVDGLVVNDSYRIETYESTEVYSLDLFVGTHEIIVAVPGLGEQSWEYEVWYNDDYFYASDITLSESGRNTLISSAKSLLEQIFEAALAQEDCSAIASSLAGDETEDLNYYYERLENYLFGSDDWRALNVTLSNFSVWDCYVYYSGGNLCAYLDLEFDCTYEYAYLRDGYLDSTDSRTNYGDFALNFVYQDGEWVPSTVQSLDV